MKALVTGGAGFIGSNVVKYLLEKNWELRIIDDLSTGYKCNLKKLNVEFTQGSICDERVVRDLCKGMDVVFHLAASVGRQRSLDNPILDSRTNLLGTISLLEAMRANGVKRIIYSSSAAIFGELITPCVEENHPLNADSPYGISKLAAEKMILAYSEIYKMKGICLRYFNIFGINQRFDKYGNVIPIFAHQIFSGQPINIYGDGTQTRDFLNVKDVAVANYLAAVNIQESGIFNIGSGSSVTINDLAALMQELCGVQVGVKYLPQRPADVMHCRADVSKSSEILGFKSNTQFEDELKGYLMWFKENVLT